MCKITYVMSYVSVEKIYLHDSHPKSIIDFRTIVLLNIVEDILGSTPNKRTFTPWQCQYNANEIAAEKATYITFHGHLMRKQGNSNNIIWESCRQGGKRPRGRPMVAWLMDTSSLAGIGSKVLNLTKRLHSEKHGKGCSHLFHVGVYVLSPGPLMLCHAALVCSE